MTACMKVNVIFTFHVLYITTPQILADEKPYFNHGGQIMPAQYYSPPPLQIFRPCAIPDLLSRKAGQQNSTWNFQRCTKEVDT